MKPTPALVKAWQQMLNGDEMEEYYYSASEKFQIYVNALINATNNEFDELIHYFKNTTGVDLLNLEREE